MKQYKKYLLIIKRNYEITAVRKYKCTSLRDRLNQFWEVKLWNSSKQHRDNVNRPFLPRFNKVTKDNVLTHWSMIRSRIIDLTTHHIRKNTCCIFHFYELHTCHANNEILQFIKNHNIQ